MTNQFIEAVTELNSELFDKVTYERDEVQDQFYYMTTGFIDVVGYGDIVLWNSEDSYRKFNEKTGEYEPFKPYLKRELRKKKESLTRTLKAI